MINSKKLLKILLVAFICCSNVMAIEQSTRIRNNTCKLYEDVADIDDKSYRKVDYFKSDKISDAKDKAKEMAEDKTYLRDRVVDNTISDDDFVKELLYDILPFAVFIVLSLLGLITYVCCFAVDLCCPKCICCKKKSSYSGFEKIWPVLGSFIFCGAVIVTGILGAVYGSTFDEGYYLFKCQVLGFLDDFIVGNNESPSSIWVGLNDLDGELKHIENKLIVEVKRTFVVENDWIENDYTKIENEQKHLWNPDKDTDTEDNIDDDDKYVYQNKSGYYNQSGESTFYNTVWKETVKQFQGTINVLIKNLKDGMTKTNDEGSKIATNDAFVESIKSGSSEIQDLIKQINDAATNIDDNTADIDENLPDIKDYIAIYFYVSMGAGALGILSCILVAILKLRKFRFFMHISWCVFSILMLVGFIIGTTLWGVSSLGFQSCQIIENILSDPEELRKLDVVDGDTMVYIETCREQYGGDGEILDQIGVNKELDTIREFQKSMTDTLAEYQNGKGEIDQLEESLEKIEQQLTALKNDGKISDQAYENAIESKFVNVYGSECDTLIRIDSTDSCSYQTDWPSSGTADKNSDKCLNYNLYEFGDHIDYCQGRMNAFNELLAWVAEKNEITNNHIREFGEYDTQVTEYLRLSKAWKEKVNNFNTGTISSLLEEVVQIVDKKSNCLFLGKNIDKIHGSMCIELIPGIYDITVVLLTHCFAMFLGAFFLYIVGFRYAQFNRQKQYEETKQQEAAYERTGDPAPQ